MFGPVAQSPTQQSFAHFLMVARCLGPLFTTMRCETLVVVFALHPGHGPVDIRRYPGFMTRDTVAVISWVICAGYQQIFPGHVANHQICTLITANNKIT